MTAVAALAAIIAMLAIVGVSQTQAQNGPIVLCVDEGAGSDNASGACWGDPDSIWFVTNGLLVIEMITGNRQFGDDQFIQYEPSYSNVAGDADDMNGPTYASFQQRNLPAGSYPIWDHVDYRRA